MSKSLNLDQLYQLLEERDPQEIRAEYSQALADDPELAKVLDQFENLDHRLEQLGQLSNPPEPDWQRIRARKPGLLVAFPRYVLPLAAVLILGLAIGSQYWQQGAWQDRASSPAMESMSEAMPQSAPPVARDDTTGGSPQVSDASLREAETRQAKRMQAQPVEIQEMVVVAEPADQDEVYELSSAAEEAAYDTVPEQGDQKEQASEIDLSDFPDLRIVAHERTDEVTEDSKEQMNQPNKLKSMNRRAEGDLQSADEWELEQPTSNDGAKSELHEAFAEAPSSVIETVPEAATWLCWQSAFLEFFRQSTLSSPAPFSDQVRISWSWLGLENADSQQLHAAIQARRAAEPSGKFSIFLLQESDGRYLVNWFWQIGEQTETGVFAMTLNENCQLTGWRELAE